MDDALAMELLTLTLDPLLGPCPHTSLCGNDTTPLFDYGGGGGGGGVTKGHVILLRLEYLLTGCVKSIIIQATQEGRTTNLAQRLCKGSWILRIQ